jgi:hypothetical protein
LPDCSDTSLEHPELPDVAVNPRPCRNVRNTKAAQPRRQGPSPLQLISIEDYITLNMLDIMYSNNNNNAKLKIVNIIDIIKLLKKDIKARFSRYIFML